MANTKKLLRDFTPPAVYRAASRMRSGAPVPAKTPSSGEVRSGEASPDWYDASFEGKDHWRDHYSQSPWYYIWTVIVDRLQTTDEATVLDIGCGPGQLAAFIRDRGITSYTGFDFSAKRIEWAKSTVPEVRFEVADAYVTDLFDSVPYNTVICTEFLEHVDRDVEVVDRIHPGTRFLGTVPNFGGGSHVRFFTDADEVTARYAKYFGEFRVDTFVMPWERKLQFLIDGIKT